MALARPLLVGVAERAKVPIAPTVDHGRNLETVVKATRLGSPSVMLGGPSLSHEENVPKTQEVIRAAHAVGVAVAELGSIAGSMVSLRAAVHRRLSPIQLQRQTLWKIPGWTYWQFPSETHAACAGGSLK